MAEIASPKSNDPIAENHRYHDYFVDGFRLTYIDSDGNEANPTIRLISQEPDQNDWPAVNQVTLSEGHYKRRFDLVLYCNGMPVSVIEPAPATFLALAGARRVIWKPGESGSALSWWHYSPARREIPIYLEHSA